MLGYGIQGRAQAHNLRDGGFEVTVGNRPDGYAEQARQDGFSVLGIREAAEGATLAILLLPDEIHAALELPLQPGAGLVVAHGFSVRYGLLPVSLGVDLMLLAPRMPGKYVRERFLAGWGVPA
ncbi:MAG: ketol-acid reductoisomerase, partial [Candidatus Eremiobacterota bacterium]